MFFVCVFVGEYVTVDDSSLCKESQVEFESLKRKCLTLEIAFMSQIIQQPTIHLALKEAT